jgi:hypothetical protein
MEFLVRPTRREVLDEILDWARSDEVSRPLAHRRL